MSFNLYIDNHSCFKHVWLVSAESQCEEKYKHTVAWWKMHHGKTVKGLQTNQGLGGEFMSSKLENFELKNGQEKSLTAHNSHEQVGMVKRANRTHLKLTRTQVLISLGLPKKLWGDALKYSV